MENRDLSIHSQWEPISLKETKWNGVRVREVWGAFLDMVMVVKKITLRKECVYLCVSVCMYVCVCMCMLACVCGYVHVFLRT